MSPRFLACALSLALLFVGSPGLAQPPEEVPTPAPPEQPAPTPQPAAAYSQAPPGYGPPVQPPAPPPPPPASRSGFTVGLSLGFGYIVVSSDDGGEAESEPGLGGLNLELGGFVSPDFAILFKISGATVSERGARVTAGIAAAAAQLWVADVLKLEGGLGLHFVDISAGGFFGSDTAFGIYLGPAVQVVELEGGHSLQVGLEYTTGFYEGGMVHTAGLVFGYQSL